MGGSLLLTHVGGKVLNKFQLIYGVPKLRYPYTEKSWATKKTQLPEYSQNHPADSHQYLLLTKWNGANILFFKYRDHRGDIRISAKSKGSATLANSQYGDFLDLTFDALGLKRGSKITRDNTPLLKPLWDNIEWQSISFELCGQKEPHLVHYDFDIALKPLFCTMFRNGNIVPFMSEEEKELGHIVGPFDYHRDKLIEQCQTLQSEALQQNEQFRKERGLKHKVS